MINFLFSWFLSFESSLFNHCIAHILWSYKELGLYVFVIMFLKLTIYIWRLLVKQPLTPPARTVIHPAGRTFHPSRPQANRRTWLHLQLSRNPKAQNLPRGKKKKKSSLCNFLLLSLAAKGKKNTAHSLCNFLLLSLATKGNIETGQGRGKGRVVQGQGRARQGVHGSKK